MDVTLAICFSYLFFYYRSINKGFNAYCNLSILSKPIYSYRRRWPTTFLKQRCTKIRKNVTKRRHTRLEGGWGHNAYIFRVGSQSDTEIWRVGDQICPKTRLYKGDSGVT